MREKVMMLGKRFFHSGTVAILMILAPQASRCEPLPSTQGTAHVSGLPSPSSALVEMEPQPFWKRKPKVYQEMLDDRRIVVSAKTQQIAETSKSYQMRVISAGIVNRSPHQTWLTIQKFEALPKVDERFQSAHFDPTTQRLKLHLATLGFHARMTLKLTLIELNESKRMHFESIEGNFKGLKGVVQLDPASKNRTEVAMLSNYESPTIPLPEVLMGVGLEVVAEKVAASMRKFIEAAGETR